MSFRTLVRCSVFGALAFALAPSLRAAAAATQAGHAPILFSTPAYESPERGDPDDLLLVSGDGLSAADSIVYEAVVDTTAPPSHPKSIPKTSTADTGVADLANVADAPHSLTVHLPKIMKYGQSYALWAVAPGGHWSAPVRINDARPLWITTDSAYQTAALANLPRTLKVVGRNLEPKPLPNGTTQVRLIGASTGTTYTLDADPPNPDRQNPTALTRYTAVVKLPASLVVDKYKVFVSRDAISWVPLIGNGRERAQLFYVLRNPGAPLTFPISDFAQAAGSPCLPDDGLDDTKCILLAIRAAAATPGGGTVSFGPGVWAMSNPGRWAVGSSFSDLLAARDCRSDQPGHCGVTYDGIVVPPGVNLQGAKSSGTTPAVIERGVGWTRTFDNDEKPSPLPGFALQGNNQVSGLVFKDDNDYRRVAAGAAMLQLGLAWYRSQLYRSVDPAVVSRVVISQNLFDKPYVAISSGGLPIDHLYITYNTFGGAYNTAVYLGQDPSEVKNLLASSRLPFQTYRFDDSVTAYNTFYPSSWNFTASSGNYGEGSIATQINTGLRTDFSNNVADGRSSHYLYDPAIDVKGWRAAYFWSTGANQEMTLVSNNVVSCPGDKNGDGESFAFDGSVTLGGVPLAEPVVYAAPWVQPKNLGGTTLTLAGSLVTVLTADGRVDISTNPTPYYRGFWVQIVAGTGKGQWRKLESLSLGNGSSATATLNVTPAFDVLPDRTSKAVVSHAYWQNVTVNNTVDQRTPPCTKANSHSGGGTMLWYDSVADSAMEGNKLYDSGGVFVHQNYAPADQSAVLKPASIALQSSNQIRGNLIDGVYSRSKTDTYGGGIQLGYGAADRYCTGKTCVSAPVPPALGYGIIIAGNRIVGADSKDPMDAHRWPRGAVTLSRAWSTGPTDAAGLSQWELVDNTLIFHNIIENISNSIQEAAPSGEPRIGIGIDPLEHGTAYSTNAWRSTLYGNSCHFVDTPLSDTGIGTVRYCPPENVDTCECRDISAINVSIAASASAPVIEAGSAVTYKAIVTNRQKVLPAHGEMLSAHGEMLSAHGVTIILEPSAGIRISDLSVTSGAGSCDLATNVCSLGALSVGRSAGVTVTATALTVGTWDTSFSVTHQEADPRIDLNGITLETVVVKRAP